MSQVKEFVNLFQGKKNLYSLNDIDPIIITLQMENM